jgi:phage-related minor tail protein
LKDVVLNSFTLIKKGISEGVDVAKGEASKLMSEAMAKEYIGDETVEKIKNGVVEAVDVAAGAVEKVNTVIADTAKSLGDKVKSVANTGSNKLKEWSNNLAETDKKTKKLKEAWEDLKRSAEGNIAGLQLEKSLIGAGIYESTYEQTLFDLISQAEEKGIDLYGKDNKIALLEEYASKTAYLTEQVDAQTQAYDFAKSTVKGFFSDMRQGLKEGQSAWEIFGNAVYNVLDKILDKMMDIGVDYLFQAGSASSKDSWFNTAISSVASWFAPGGSAEGAKILAAAGGPGKIGVKPTMAANGGVFSNGIYSSPTMFAFAKGGKFGVMGEAGPEAVMPLTRGPDGSLGVRADGGSSAPVIVNVINNSNAQAKTEQRQTSQGVEIDVLIDEMVAEKMGRPGTSSNNALRAFNNQKLVAR